MKLVMTMRILKAASTTVTVVAVLLVVIAGLLLAQLPSFNVAGAEVNPGMGARVASALTPDALADSESSKDLIFCILILLLGMFGGLNWFLLRQVRRARQREFDMAKLSLVSQKTDNAILILDQEGHIDWVNEGFTRVTGHPSAEVKGKFPGSLLLGSRHDAASIQSIREAVTDHKKVSLEMYCTHKQGHHYWLALHLNPVFSEAEKVVHFVGIGTDITVRKRVEDALARASRRNELLLHAMAEGICGLDLNGLVTFINPAVTRLTGWTSDELIGKPIGLLVHQLRMNAMPGTEANHFMDVAFKDDTVLMGDIDKFRRKDGALFPVEFTNTPIREGEQLVGSVVVFRDVTEQRKHEAARVRQAKQFALRAEIGFALATCDSIRGFLQPCIEAMVKHLDAAQGRIWIYRPEEKELEMEASAGLSRSLKGPENRVPIGTMKAGKVAQARVPEMTNDLAGDPDEIDQAWVREERLVSFLGLPLVVENKLVAVIGIYARHKFPEDTLEMLSAVADSIGQGLVRKRAEVKLAHHAALLDKAQDAFMEMDLTARCRYWNRSAERLYGWKAEDILGERLDHHLMREPAAFEEARKAVLAQGEWKGELVQMNRREEMLKIESQWTLVRDEQGQPRSILMVNTDISGRKEMESKLLRAQRMESIGTLAGGIAHDLNNVLSPILMSVEILKDKHRDEQSQRLLTLVESSAKRGGDMVKQVLTFSRGVDGERVMLQTRHLINEVVRIVDETFPKSIKLEIALAENLWTITGDATQLHQILVNLTVNARDAMPRGGKIKITAENTILEKPESGEVEGFQPGFYVMIRVEDSGTGIPQSQLNKIFDPFFTTKANGEGTGLGLSTVRGIVQGHGGFIKVESWEGKGSRFSVYLPAQEASQAQAEEEGMTGLPTGSGELILAVDDEASVLTMTKEMLETYGYRVVTARDGTEAVAAFSEHRDQIRGVVTDMLMPYMDGPATIRTLKKMDPNVRIVAASGLMDSEKVKDATGLDNIAFLMKPFTAQNLLGAVWRMVHEEESPERPAPEWSGEPGQEEPPPTAVSA